MKKTIGFLAALLAIGVLGYGAYIIYNDQQSAVNKNPVSTASSTVATSTAENTEVHTSVSSVIGTSVEGRDIVAYHFGTGAKKILFVGGIHGGYEWNTVLVAFQFVDYLTAHPEIIPSGIQVTIIPVLNPDGLNKVVGTPGRFAASDVPSSQAQQISGRFNAHTVDLNRNFDCEWKSKGTWQNTAVSGGSAPFSEPESLAMKKYVATLNPTAAVVWYSSAGGVYSSDCHVILPETATLTNLFAQASGYPAHEVFNYYEITGDMVNWLASQKIPAISVLLTNHTDTEWEKNLAGIEAVLNHYAQ